MDDGENQQDGARPETPELPPGTPPWARHGGNPAIGSPGVVSGPAPSGWNSPSAVGVPPAPGVPPMPGAAPPPVTPAGWAPPTGAPVTGAPTGFAATAPGAVPPGVVSPGLAEPGQYSPGAVTSPTPTPFAAEPRRTILGTQGLPPMVALSVIIMGFPPLLFLGMGLITLTKIAGSPYGTGSTFGLGGGYEAQASATAWKYVILSVAALICILLAAAGKRIGRVLCTIGLVIVVGWLAKNMVDQFSHPGYDSDDIFLEIGLYFIPPTVALIGLYTPTANNSVYA